MSEYEPFKLNITWTYEDIKSIRPNWSDDKCDEFLSSIAGDIEDRSIEVGWDVINMLADMEGDEDE